MRVDWRGDPTNLMILSSDTLDEFTREGGEPVDLASGVFVLEKTDLTIPGRAPIVFTRTYRSDDTRVGPFGVSSRHNYELLVGVDGVNYAPWRMVLPTNFHVFFDGPNNTHTSTPLRANVLETPTPFEFSVEGGEVLSNGIQE